MKIRKIRLFLVSCAVVLVTLVSCDRVALNEEPSAGGGAPASGGYPDIQATINASLDKALALVATAARRADRDTRYATLARTLRRERDGDWATARVLNPDSSVGVTEEEQEEIDSLMADDPALDAAFGGLADELQSQYAAIPPVEITVQNYDDNDNPIGAPHTIRSENGVIDLGYRVFTVQEFLLWVRSQQRRPERGFIIARDWYHPEFGTGRLWPNARVNYFFDNGTSASDVNWMANKLSRTQSATGIRFVRYITSGNMRYQWSRCTGRYLKVARVQLGSYPGRATIGRVGCSFLRIDNETARDEEGEVTFYHEAGHVVGLIHEHQREDRSRHVSVSRTGSNYDCISLWRNQRFWFLFWSWVSAVPNTTTYNTPYDYHSVMHYRSARNAITLRNGSTWDVWSRNKSVWGSQNHSTYFTPWDLYTIKRRYVIRPNPRPTYTPRPAYP